MFSAIFMKCRQKNWYESVLHKSCIITLHWGMGDSHWEWYTEILPFQILACYLNIWRGVQNSDSVHLLSIKLVAAIIFARRMLSLYCAAPHFETLFVNNRVHHRLISGLSALVGAPSSNAWLCLSLILAWGVQVYLCLILAFKEVKYVVGKLLPMRLLEEVARTLHNLQVLWPIKILCFWSNWRKKSNSNSCFQLNW